jgi:DNA-binding NarL/FixJ family response regulator
MSTMVVDVEVKSSNCAANPLTNPVWQEQFLSHVLPVVEDLARFRFRSLPAAEQEEATAEAVAGALISFVRLARRGRDPREFAPRLAQIALLRVLAGRLAGSPDRSQDVLSRLARQQRGFTVQSFDAGERLEAGSHQAPQDWRDLVLEDGRSTPADIAILRLDFTAWLGRMNHRRRQIAETLAAGYRTDEVARQFQLSPGRISQLRREFEASWEAFQRDVPQASKAPSHTAT